MLDLLRKYDFIPYVNNLKFHTAQTLNYLDPHPFHEFTILHIFVLNDALPIFALKISFAKVNHPVLRGNSVKADVCVKALKMYFCICFNTQLGLCQSYFLICSSIYLPSAFVPLRDQKTKTKKTPWCDSFLCRKEIPHACAQCRSLAFV